MESSPCAQATSDRTRDQTLAVSLGAVARVARFRRRRGRDGQLAGDFADARFEAGQRERELRGLLRIDLALQRDVAAFGDDGHVLERSTRRELLEAAREPGGARNGARIRGGERHAQPRADLPLLLLLVCGSPLAELVELLAGGAAVSAEPLLAAALVELVAPTGPPRLTASLRVANESSGGVAQPDETGLPVGHAHIEGRVPEAPLSVAEWRCRL